MTLFPQRDIEHFFYHNGYEKLFINIAYPNDIPSPNEQLNPTRIIKRAIHRTSKPDVALRLIQAIRENGKEGIPLLIRQLINRLLSMSKSQQ